jgi:hypothetical protein
MKPDDPFALENLRLVQVPRTPHKIAKRRHHFIQVPFVWLERLNGASGKAYAVALHIQYLHWRNKGKPFALANGMLQLDGVNRKSKWRALESRGLISLERRRRRSPIVTVLD